jgi:hypothetical protein
MPDLKHRFRLLHPARCILASRANTRVLEKIREVLAASPFYGEGHRKA